MSFERAKPYSAKYKERRERAIADGKCVDCGSLVYKEKSTVKCQKCYDREVEYRRNRDASRKASGICSKCPSLAIDGKTRCQKHLDEQRAFTKNRHARYKDAAYNAYGGYVCVCCDETENVFLELDHVHGGGNQHRRDINNGSNRGGGYNIFKWLRDHRYPSGMMQVLCCNCNKGKSRNGGICPHQIPGTRAYIELQVRRAAKLSINPHRGSLTVSPEPVT